MSQVLWILDHLADLDADFRVFYRMSWREAVATLTGPELMALAWRVTVYQGVMAARIAARRRPAASGAREVDSSQASLRANLGDLIEFGG